MSFLLSAQENFHVSPSLSIWLYLFVGAILVLLAGLVGPRLWRRRRSRAETAPDES